MGGGGECESLEEARERGWGMREKPGVREESQGERERPKGACNALWRGTSKMLRNKMAEGELGMD